MEAEPAVLAVDIGATNTRVALVDTKGIIRASLSEKTPVSGNDPTIIARRVKEMAERLLGPAGWEAVGSVGISGAGPVDRERGSLINPPNIPFPEVPLAGPLGEGTRLPITVLNDCHAGVIGERCFGEGMGYRNMVYLTLSTGIGAGVILDGRLILGSEGNAAEVGHFHVDSALDLPCGCGYTGHWEGYASGRFLPRFFSAWWGKDLSHLPFDPRTPEGIFSAAGEGNPIASAFLDRLAVINGRGISDIIVAYNPDLIVFDGSVVVNNVPEVLERAIPRIDRYLTLPRLAVTALGGTAPLVGAAVASGIECRGGDLARVDWNDPCGAGR
ncbi:glucokinase [Methanolinea mesophila]|nr:glucokinase [Methanolinea mesophila]